MSSDNTNSTNHASASSNASLPSENTNNLPTKLNLSTSTTRLTSFRVPRDLTLTASTAKLEKPKKVFVPNLNVQRIKKKDEPVEVKKNSKTPKDRNKGSNADRGRNKQNKGKLIQSTGVFSEGLSDVAKSSANRHYSAYSNDRSDSKVRQERPKLNLPTSGDSADDEERLKLLLRDDFIDDDDVEIDYHNAPISLPLLDSALLFKEEPEIKVDFDAKGEKKKSAIIKNKAKFSSKGKLFPQAPSDEKIAITIPQVLENKSNGYFLIQLPDCLPGAPNETEANEVRPGKKNESVPESEKGKKEFCMLDNLKEGLLGKLQILKSGRGRLLLGENHLIVDLGSNVSFRQDLIAAKIDTEQQSGELVNLGIVSSTLICSPDWECMLANL